MWDYEEMSPAQQIEHDYGGTQLTDDVNHHRRRFFRCWLDGSYNGESHYRANCEVVRKNYRNWSKLREFVLSEFVDYTAKEYEISKEDARNALKKAESEIMSAASKKIVHKKAAARKISRLSKRIKSIK